MYAAFLVARFQETILLIVQHKCLNLVWRIRWSKIWSSAQYYAVLVLLLNMVESFISARSYWSDGNNLYQFGTSSQTANRWGWPIKICAKQRLRWGWVFFERTRSLSKTRFKTHFIELFIVETKWFVGSNVNVILTPQTCRQRSSRAAGSKRRTPEIFIPSEFATCSQY